MNVNEYQRLALVTANKSLTPVQKLENGVMGLCGEAGEVIDIVKKHLFHSHPLDADKLKDELGDVAWYLARTADIIGYGLDEIFQMNIDKLKARYPEGFDSERSINRTE